MLLKPRLNLCLLFWILHAATATRPYRFPEGLEIREAESCVDEALTLACHSDQEIILTQAVLYAAILARGEGLCTIPVYNRQHKKGSVLPYLNHKCSGEQRCEFNLWDDVPGAADNASYWQGGIILAHYTCVNDSEWVEWCEGVASGQSGWLRSPGYPKLYTGPDPCSLAVVLDPGQKVVLTFPDIHLKDPDPTTGCRDTLTVQEPPSSVLVQRCGTLHDILSLTSSQHILNITLNTTKIMVPAKGFVAHFTAIGCPSPPVPSNGSVTFRNASHAEVSCRDGYAFFDSDSGAVKDQLLACRRQTWPKVDECEDLFELLSLGNITQAVYDRLYNSSTYGVISASNAGSLIFDLVVPAVIMSVLLLGNVLVVLLILYCRRSTLKDASSDEWDSIKSNVEPTDVSDPVAPSRV